MMTDSCCDDDYNEEMTMTVDLCFFYLDSFKTDMYKVQVLLFSHFLETTFYLFFYFYLQIIFNFLVNLK